MVVGLSRIALLVNGGDPEGARRYIEQSQAAAAPLGITIEPVEVQGIGDIPRAFSKIDQLKVNGLVGTADHGRTKEHNPIGNRTAPANNDAFQRNNAGWCAHVLCAELRAYNASYGNLRR